jgi:hypothetical protein
MMYDIYPETVKIWSEVYWKWTVGYYIKIK